MHTHTHYGPLVIKLPKKLSHGGLVGICRIMLELPILFLAFLSSVSAHGGVLWPPIWQAGVATPIEELTTYAAFSDPKVHDHRYHHH